MAWQNLGITYMTMSFKPDTKLIACDSKNNSKINFKNVLALFYQLDERKLIKKEGRIICA